MKRSELVTSSKERSSSQVRGLNPYLVVRHTGESKEDRQLPIVVIPRDPDHHSHQPNYMNEILTDIRFYSHLGHAIQNANVVRLVTEDDCSDLSPSSVRADGEMVRYTFHGLLESLRMLPPRSHEFWDDYIDAVTIPVFYPYDRSTDSLIQRYNAAGITKTYFFRYRE